MRLRRGAVLLAEECKYFLAEILWVLEHEGMARVAV